MSKEFKLWCIFLGCSTLLIAGACSLIVQDMPSSLYNAFVLFMVIVAAILSIPVVKGLCYEPVAKPHSDKTRLDWLQALTATQQSLCLVKIDVYRKHNKKWFTVVTDSGTHGDFEDIRNAIDAAIKNTQNDVKEISKTIKHVCKESKSCVCDTQGFEPDEECPQHGDVILRPRCGFCGRFMKYIQ